MGRSASLLAALCGCLLASAAVGVEPCAPERGCAELVVTGPATPVAVGEAGTVTLAFEQGPADAAEGGIDEIAAMVLSLAIPGLELASCAAPDANGLTAAFTVPPGLADVALFVVNTTCAGRASCLCPDAGQPRDEYVNLIFAGPREIDPADPFPTLPAGEVLSIALRVTASAPARARLHVFNPGDDAAAPPGAALLSVADVLAVDVTVDRAAAVSNVRVRDGEIVRGAVTATPPASPSATPPASPTATASASPSATASARPSATATVAATATATAAATPTTTPPVPPSATPTTVVDACVGDCNGDRAVSIGELIVAVSIALGSAPLEQCPAIDCAGDAQVNVACLIAAVGAGLSGCPAP